MTDTSTCRLVGALGRGVSLSLIDAIIAATAIELNLPVATLNVKDFERVEELKIYSWTK